MSRRPPGQVALPRKCRFLVIAALLLPWLQVVDAQQQQQTQLIRADRQVKSPPEADHHPSGASALAATAVIQGRPLIETAETPHIIGRRKNTVVPSKNAALEANGDRSRNPSTSSASHYEHIHVPNDARALETLALDSSSVRAPSLLRPRGPSGLGLSSLQQNFARSLEDWEVEDFVLLATVDGDLYASDRKTGVIRWHLEVEQPMVETKHYRANQSVLDEDYSPVDSYIWVVEPNRDGGLFLWVPHGDSDFRLLPMTTTMKEMVASSPFTDPHLDLLYTGKQETTLFTLDAATGRVLKWFGPNGSQRNEMASCIRPTSTTLPGMNEEECSNMGTITLGRTEYTVNIGHQDGRPIAVLKYSEWVPNASDNDLIGQHQATPDNYYVTSRHDGQTYGLNYGRFDEDTPSRPFFSQRLNSPAARVFDVLRRWESAPGSNPDLTVIPQPTPPIDDESTKHVLINKTEAGGWYALSGTQYPLIVEAPSAPIHTRNWLSSSLSWDSMDEAQLSKALVGKHPLHTDRNGISDDIPPTPLLTLPAGPTPGGSQDRDNETVIATVPAPPTKTSFIPSAKEVPQIAFDSIINLVSNPAAIALVLGLLLWFQADLRKWYNGRAGKFIQPNIEIKSLEPSTYDSESDPAAVARATVPPELAASPAKRASSVEEELHSALKSEEALRERVHTVPVKNENTAVPEKEAALSAPAVTIVEPEKAEKSSNDGDIPPEKKGKKSHRGRRGGVKHRKGQAKRELSQSRDDDAPATVEEVVNKAKNLGVQPRLEPDIQTVTNDVEEISGPILRMGSLEVNEDQQLGTGSNGTVVFAGKWDGRDVAVKRMLIQFNEIASQETKLLRESDDHPNVIRYFAQQQRAAFLYIALELCQASLADVIQKPYQYRELAQAGERDIPAVLLQVANGLSYLHGLRIVHRDLKPQNILVNLKDGKPRLLVSDFGLCKKLEGTNSSFGATTAHAAGTSGWRAPELLIDDNTPAGSGSGSVGINGEPVSSMGHSASGSVGLVGEPVLGPHHRRVTRAIDIFSLGLVFFYVLTKGNHPFDCGDRYMREVNIRKGNYNLQPLEVLGDYAFEAQDLITSMLSANPRNRPSAREVMGHPFFWTPKKRLAFLCDVSDHFEKETRDPPSEALSHLERTAEFVVRGDFLKHLPKEFVDSLGKQRKYTGSRLLDLLRALRNKRNHYEDMPDALKKMVGDLQDGGYLGFWTRRFPNLLITCWNVVYDIGWDETGRFKEYYEPELVR